MTKTRRQKPRSTTVQRLRNRSRSRSTSLLTKSTNISSTPRRTRKNTRKNTRILKKKNRSQPSLSINPYLNLIEYIKNHEEHKLIEAIERIYREHNGCSNTKQECYEEKCL